MKVQIRGRRFNFALGSANKEEAAKTAAQIYNELITLGIEATLAKRRPQPPPVKVVAIATIGDWISAAGRVFEWKAYHLRRLRPSFALHRIGNLGRFEE